MKRPLAITGSFFLIFGAVFCASGALISAFSFNVDFTLLLPVWLISALALSVFVSLLRGKGILILLPAGFIALLLKLPGIVEGGKWAIRHITSEYNKWLYVPVIFPDANASSHELTLFFAILGVALAFFISASVCLQRSAFLTIFFTAPLVFLTVILIETQPDVRLLLGLTAVYLTLIISSSLHPYNFIKRGMSVFPALALSLLLLGSAYLAAPPDSYRRGNLINDIDERLRTAVERVGAELQKRGTGWPESMTDRWLFNTNRVDIADAGTRAIMDRSLLEITAEQAGTFYLRGFSMLSFEGREWRGNADMQSPFDEYAASLMPAMIAEAFSGRYPNNAPINASMSIAKTGESSDLFYRPYYSLPLSNTGYQSYTVNFYHTEESIAGLYGVLSSSADGIARGGAPPLSAGARNLDMSGYNAQVRSPSIYTQIEDSTAEGLRKLAAEAGIDPDADRAVIADMVAEYISSSARYTLMPYITPEGEDFALYFLQYSKRGYCIHFATAAALMLRAMDIPARFTSGFVVTVRASGVGNTTVVTDRNAHAWVEVYYDDVGWIPLEATPASPGSGVPLGLSHSADVAAPYLYEYDYEAWQYDLFGDELMLPEDFAALESDSELSQTPEENAGAGGQASGDSAKPASRALLAAIAAATCVLAVILFRAFVRKCRKKRFGQADANKAVLCIWRYASRLNRREKPPEEMEMLALKARFSHHRITEEERAEMLVSTRDYYAEAYKRRNLFGRIWLKYFC